jgi:hypothetical protein
MKKAKPRLKRLTAYAASLGILSMLLLALSASPDGGDQTTSDASMGLAASSVFSTNYVPNGGFENDSLGWTWVQDASVSTEVVRTGTKALKTTDIDSTRFAYVHRELNFVYDTTEITFWAYPASASYVSTVELIANWQHGTATFITRVGLRDNVIGFTAVDTSVSIPNVLEPGAWNKITIKADAATMTQHFYVNDSLYSSLTSSELPAVENLLVGDLSGVSHYGTVYYDDISITGTVKSPEPVAIDDHFVDDGNEPKFFPVLNNDVVPEGFTVEIEILTPPEHGEILSIEEGGVWFQKDDGFVGSDQFSYTLTTQTQGAHSKIASTSTGNTSWQAKACDCFFLLFGSCSALKAESVVDPVRTVLGAAIELVADSVDIALLTRWRDELLRTTEAGDALVDDLIFNSPEILQLVIVEKPQITDQIISLFILLQDPARSLLDGDGSEVITQAQMDSVAALFTALQAGATNELGDLLQGHLEVLGPFDKYVGLSAREAFDLFANPVRTAVEDELPETSTGFALEQNFPNPFVATTQIRYALDHPTVVSLAVYDIRGRKVRTLTRGQLQQGTQLVTWNGTDDSGTAVPSGVYFVQLETDTFRQAKRMVVVN